MTNIIQLHPDTEWHIECPNCGDTAWNLLLPAEGLTYLDVSGYRCYECGYEVEIESEE